MYRALLLFFNRYANIQLVKHDIVTAIIYCYITTKFHDVKLDSYICWKAYLITFFAWRESSVTCNRRILFTSKEKNTLTFQMNINIHMLKGFLTSSKVLLFSRENSAIASGEVNTIQSYLSSSTHSMADARRNTFFSALNIPFESEQKKKFRLQNHLLCCACKTKI